MDNNYGKLVLLSEDGPEQEFELGKARVTIGRGTTNDILLSDGRVSRSHVRLECAPGICTLVEMGSSNGSYVKSQRVEWMLLQPGDLISLGSSQFRYELSPAVEEMGMTVIDREADLDKALDLEVLPCAVNETGQPRPVVMTPQPTWEAPLGDVDVLTIGRVDSNQLVLEHSKVSRQHAEVQRKGNLFLLRDLGSTNGTWHGDTCIEQLILQEGDEFKIGEATLVFKSGFEEESLTLADTRIPSGQSRWIVIFVPGLMGSELWRGNERIFPHIKTLFTNPETLRYPEPAEPRKIVDEVVIVPNLVKLDQYKRLGDYLVSGAKRVHYGTLTIDKTNASLVKSLVTRPNDSQRGYLQCYANVTRLTSFLTKLPYIFPR